jgi:hypothetical protein
MRGAFEASGGREDGFAPFLERFPKRRGSAQAGLCAAFG